MGAQKRPYKIETSVCNGWLLMNKTYGAKLQLAESFLMDKELGMNNM